jgi:hypothetical protein
MLLLAPDTAVGADSTGTTNAPTCTSLTACSACLDAAGCIWCDTGKKIGDAVGLETSTGTCETSCKLGSVAEVKEKDKCPKASSATMLSTTRVLVIAVISFFVVSSG